MLVAACRIAAGAEVRFNYEAGGPRGTYWGGRGRPAESLRWRKRLLRPPPPTSVEPTLSGAPPSIYAPSVEERRVPGSPSKRMVGGRARAATDGGGGGGGGWGGGGGGGVGDWSDARSPPSATEDARQPLAGVIAWEGARGGDAILTGLIGRLKRSEWLRGCSLRTDGKARMWQLVASHLPGRTAAECQERWRCVTRGRSVKP